MIYVVIVFLWLSVCLYMILGGADFGAGIVEFLTPKRYKAQARASLYKTMGPIWEANHMWLIIAIVVLFVGFPTIYATLSTYLHIPLILLLLGIIARGTAFTFRNYDAVQDDWEKVYTRIFVASSIFAPFFLGIIAAATVSGHIDPQAHSFADQYIFSWLNPFGISVGIFTVGLCGYLASIFSIANLDNKNEQTRRIKEINQTIVLVILTGLAVFVTAYFTGVPLLTWVISEPVAIAAVVLATVSLVILIVQLRKRNFKYAKILGGFQMIMILVAATYSHFPNLVLLKGGGSLSLFDEHGADKTIQMLGWALLIGSCFILPFLFYLMYSFGIKKDKTPTID